MTLRAAISAAFALAFPVGEALGQCPDGTPPPCRSSAAAVPTRRPSPPLDDRTWIVVPFENVARVADIDWLKDASVNLLYMDMSKWTDIRVIDDERVADLIREVPEARGGAQLTLQSGIAVARRAGAGKLVMGDLLKVGPRTQIVGKVFDVRTGQRLRTVRQEALSSDSIMASFGLLARGVLNLAPPSGGSAGGIGTASVGAYQAYIAGVAYLNRWILDSARMQFTQALALDSTFALAHYKLALVYGWDSPGVAEGPRHAGLAARLGNGLPPRERALVSGYAAFSTHHYAEACEIFGRMVKADSTDVEGWYNLGECSYHDPAVVAVGGDSSHIVFRGNWNTMLRAFRKTLELDPTYHLAFQHIQDALLVSTRSGCALRGEATQCSGTSPEIYQAFLLRDADSLVMVPVKLSGNADAYAAQGLKWGSQHARAANLEEARRAAEVWLQAGPNESRPRAAYARILLRMGDANGARAMLRQMVPNAFRSRVEISNLWTDRIEAAIKVDSITEAVLLADSLRTMTDTIPGIILGDVVWSVFGHRKPLAAAITKSVDGPPWVSGYFRMQADAMLGLTSDSLFAAEAQFVKNLTPSQGAVRAAQLSTGTLVWIDPRLRGGALAGDRHSQFGPQGQTPLGSGHRRHRLYPGCAAAFRLGRGAGSGRRRQRLCLGRGVCPPDCCRHCGRPPALEEFSKGHLAQDPHPGQSGRGIHVFRDALGSYLPASGRSRGGDRASRRGRQRLSPVRCDVAGCGSGIPARGGPGSSRDCAAGNVI
jgi:tetratricopeptide (TPR) repeat protein/TolB-like protein